MEMEAVTNQALGKLYSTIERLVDKYPLHAAILKRMKIIHQPSVKTLAVSVGGPPDDAWGEEGRVINFYYCPDFVLETPLIMLVGDLLHEVHHVLFGHLTMSRKDYPHHNALVVAQEVTVNEFVKEPLQDWVITLDKYPELPPLESTVQRYERLVKTLPEAKVVISFDDHEMWAQVEGAVSEQDAQEAVGKAVEKAIQDAIEDVREGKGSIPKELAEKIMSCGTAPGHILEQITDTKKGKINWEQQLQKYIGQITEVRPMYHRPNRRFPELMGIIPGKGRTGDKPKIMAVLDSSGSTYAYRGVIAGELDKMCQHQNEVLVVECDTHIDRVYQYHGLLKDMGGGGGTSFCPPLERKFLQKHKPDLIVYFTDGFGRAPDMAPRIPLVWVLLPNGEVPAPYGKVIYCDEREV